MGNVENDSRKENRKKKRRKKKTYQVDARFLTKWNA